MTVRNFALGYGVIFLLVGIAGFIPGLTTPAPPDASMHTATGLLFGLFPVNALHNLVHIVFGIWGLFVFQALPRAVVYLRAVAVIYGLFVVMGLFPLLNTTFGFVPLYGHDIWLHAVLALVAAYAGWGIKETT